MTFCDYSFPLFGSLVLFPSPDTLQTPRVLPIDWLFVHLNALFVWRIMIDGLWGWWAWLCSQSLVPFSACLGNLTWPALRMGSELFRGVVLVTLAAEFEIWPRLLKLHESSSLWVQTWNLISADDCTVRSAGSQQLREANTVRTVLQNQNRFLSLALDVKFGSHSFLMALSFWSVLHFSTTAAVENCSVLCFQG